MRNRNQLAASFIARRILVALCLLESAIDTADGDQADAARQGAEVAKEFCYRCHGDKFNGSPDLNLLDPLGLVEHGYLDPEDVTESLVWQRVAEGEMPPETSGLSMADEEKAVFKRWLELGAPVPAVSERPYVGIEEVLGAIHADLIAAGPDAPFRRYFTLWNLHNDWSNVDASGMRSARAALSKAINSLSWEPEVVLPRLIDRHKTVLAIDLRDLGWTTALWGEIVGEYPYGSRYDDPRNPVLRNLDQQVYVTSGATLCFVRADWFVHTAMRPPLYHKILDLPRSDALLEEKLGVDVHKNFRLERLARAGFATSGVSTGNRLVERHPSPYGYYWKSYDFQRTTERGNLFRSPLGPPGIGGNEYRRFAFVHDGGEFIFSLPNGLQGYFLVDGQGHRIDAGPIDVVRDSKETSGSPVVVNGVSCIHCHASGMICKFRDAVREGSALSGGALEKVLALYPPAERMKTLLEGDRARFIAAAEATMGPYLRFDEDTERPTDALAEPKLRSDEDEDRPIDAFAEPIGGVVIRYDRDLNLATASAELGMPDPETLRDAIRYSPALAEIGLMPLANDRTIKRSEWEKRATRLSPSPAQAAAQALSNASPFRPL